MFLPNAVLFGDIGEAALGNKVGCKPSPCKVCICNHLDSGWFVLPRHHNLRLLHGLHYDHIKPGAGHGQGRSLVYWTVYTLDATRCVILQLAAMQSLQHAVNNEAVPLYVYGAIVAVAAVLLAQVGAQPPRRTACLLSLRTCLTAINIIWAASYRVARLGMTYYSCGVLQSSMQILEQVAW